jgi:protein gp37
MSTKIEWTDETWNPVTGCDKVSPGCQHCYAQRMARRLAGRYGYPADDPFRVTLHPDRLDQPLHWKKPRRVFVCSMSDLFHEDLTLGETEQVLKVMLDAPQHTYQILTKRPERMKIAYTVFCQTFNGGWPTNPLPNVWLGVTAEDQKRADERIPTLLQTPAAVRFVSVEPMLGPVDFSAWLWCKWCDGNGGIDGMGYTECPHCNGTGQGTEIGWMIVGCESGPGRRPMKLEWAVDLVEQCKAAGVPVFVKAIEIDGKVSHSPAEWPEELRVREYPDA